MSERWLPIPAYEGRYDVSDLGRVRSWRSKDGALAVPRLKLPTLSEGRYLLVGLSNGSGRTWAVPVHRLVLLAFVGPLPQTTPRTETRHLNGVKLDNRLTNLAYGTARENKRDAVRHGQNAYAAATHCKRGHPFDEANTYRYINASGNPSRRCRTCSRMLYRRAYYDGRLAVSPKYITHGRTPRPADPERSETLRLQRS